MLRIVTIAKMRHFTMEDATSLFIFLEYFIVEKGYMWAKILEVLQRKVAEGVEVRLMYDGTCAFNYLPYRYPDEIKKILETILTDFAW